LIILLISVAFVFAAKASCYLRSKSEIRKDVRYILPAQEFFSLCSSRGRSLPANLFYVRGVMALTDDYTDHRQWLRFVQGLFSLAVKLDPELKESCFFAGLALGESEYALRRGIAFLKQHRYLYPQNWEIPYWIGFNYYLLGQHLKASRYYSQASALPGSPSYLESNQPMLFYKAGRPDLGIAFLRSLQSSVRVQGEKKWLKGKLQWLETILFLEEKVKEFELRFGYRPGSLQEIKQKGLIKAVPENPFGSDFVLDKQSGRVKSVFYPYSRSRDKKQNRESR